LNLIDYDFNHDEQLLTDADFKTSDEQPTPGSISKSILTSMTGLSLNATKPEWL
jgi:hypothetical protein